MAAKANDFFESRRRHVVTVNGRRVIGAVLWGKTSGTAYVADKEAGLLRLDKAEADRVWQSEVTGGRPRLFDEPVQRVLVTLPKRLLELSCPDKDYSRQIAKILEQRAMKKD